MIRLEEGIILYHGSYVEVRNIDLSRSEVNKDFGKGFYVTSSKEQAISFIKLSLKKAKFRNLVDEKQSYGFLSMFKLSNIEELKIKYFDYADAEWLHYVAANRDNQKFKDMLNKYCNYNVIVGKIANDRTAVTLQAYLEGIYGEVGTTKADDAAIATLLPEKLDDQICFKDENAIKCLEFIGSEKNE